MFSFFNRIRLHCSGTQLVKGIQGFLLAMFLVSLQSAFLVAFAQGLVGAPVDPRQGTCCGSDSLECYDSGFEQAVIVYRFLVAAIAVIACFWPIPKKHCGHAGLVAAHILARVAVPVLAFFAGSDFLYHSYGVVPSFFTW